MRFRPLAECRLYTFVDTAYLRGRDPIDIARQLCDGGSDLIQLRAKGSTLEEVRQLALLLLPVVSAAKVRLVINDHPEIATEIGAPCLHLGQEDFFDAGHQHVEELPQKKQGIEIGLSTHTPDQCARAINAGADYVAIGPVFATGTKPLAMPVTLEYVRWAAGSVRLPWFAIGGISLETVESVVQAGARRICVVSAILNSRNIIEACREFRRRID
ncbi:MAG: thiamine phosphate synthase [Pedosphaera sp.]|nr:thiamine phosphate synthase [Pedosphaera sp.]